MSLNETRLRIRAVETDPMNLQPGDHEAMKEAVFQIDASRADVARLTRERDELAATPAQNLAKVRAEALREAARSLFSYEEGPYMARTLNSMADRIEAEAAPDDSAGALEEATGRKQ